MKWSSTSCRCCSAAESACSRGPGPSCTGSARYGPWRLGRSPTSSLRGPGRAEPSAHCFLHQLGDRRLFRGRQRLQREGGGPQLAVIERRHVAEAERRVPGLELLRALEEADDLALFGIRRHPVPQSRCESRRAGLDDDMEPLRHGAIRFRHLGDLREHGALPVRLGLLQLLGPLLHRGALLARESLGLLAGRAGALGGLGGAVLRTHENLSRLRDRNFLLLGLTSVRRMRIQGILAFLIIYIVWGSTFLAIRYAVETIPPFLTAATRHLIAGAILLAWAWRNGERPSKEAWRAGLMLGFLFFLFGHGTSHWAEQKIPSGVAALVIATEPIFVALMLPLFKMGRRPGL